MLGDSENTHTQTVNGLSLPEHIAAQIDTSLLDISKPIEIQNFINSQFESLSEGIDILSPRSNSKIGTLPDSTVEDLDRAIEAAKIAFETWSKTSREIRSKLLKTVANLIRDKYFETFCWAESLDTGKPIDTCRLVDIPRVIKNFEFFSNYILNWYPDSSLTLDVEGQESFQFESRQPIGVAGLVTPWNLPAYLLSWKIAPCLAAGNTCVCKPSEVTSLTAYLLCKVIQEAGIPSGVVNMVFGYGYKLGDHLTSHADVPVVSFTGGTETGKRVAASAAPLFKKLSLELGGKNPSLIFDDCDFDQAVQTSLRAAFSNQGQICLCCSRIYVQDTIYDKFVAKFVEGVKNEWKIGDPWTKGTKVGSVVSQVHKEKILSLIQLGRDEGGEILIGGDDSNSLANDLKEGYFINPTVIVGLDPVKSKLLQTEIFGPVVTINKFSTEEEAIKYANNTRYGLTSSVWTENGKRARRVAGAIKSGMVWVNCWMVRNMQASFGGSKDSGIGREGGTHSLSFYTELKSVTLKD